MPPDSLLDRPQERARLWPLTVEAYHALGEAGLIPEKTELLYGFVFNKMPKSPIHSYLLRRLAKLLEAIIGPGFMVRTEQPITMKHSEPEPDLVIIEGKDDDYIRRHPNTAELVVEIAVTSEDYDREKAAAYAAAGIKEFWIVLVSQKQIEIYTRPEGMKYLDFKLIGANQQAICSVVPGFVVTPSELIPE
jgi:Uma2 family endonuclease